LKVLIVGAGIAGLAAARAFEMHGYKPDLVERSNEPSTAGQGIFLLGNTTRALSRLGLGEKINALAMPIAGQTIMSPKGAVLHHMPTADAWAACGPCLAIERSSLVRTMLGSLEQTDTQFGATVLHTIPRKGYREVYLSDGRVGEYDLVVGADGIRSSLRAATFSASAPRQVGLAAWRFITDNTYGIDRWIAMLGSKRTLLAIPLGGSKLYVYADCPLAQFEDGSISTLKRLFRDFAEPLAPIIQDVKDDLVAHRGHIEEVIYRDFLAERLALIGDAAHASSPSMAQGAGMAIEDAIALAESVATQTTVHDAMISFRDKRQERVKWVQTQSQARDRLRAAPDFVRNMLLRTVGDRLYYRYYGSLIEPL